MTDLRKEVFLLAKERLTKEKRICLELCTGFGKSKIALDIATDLGFKNVLVLVPTDAIQEAWGEEIRKWNCVTPIQIMNYASLHKVRNMVQPDLVIADEVHHLATDLRMESARLLTCCIVGLSATVNSERAGVLSELGFKKNIKVTLDEALEEDLIVPYEFSVITFPLNEHANVIHAGNKTNPWLTTEPKGLAYLESRIAQAKHSRNQKSIEFSYFARMRFIRNLPSRIEVAKKMLVRLRARYPNAKILVFAPDIKICEELTQNYYHSKSDSSGLDAFRLGKSNILGSVGCLDEGVNLKCDIALIVATMSQPLRTIQRLGRILRLGEDGKLGKCFVLCAGGTQDETWVKNSTDELSIVKHYKAKDLGLC